MLSCNGEEPTPPPPPDPDICEVWTDKTDDCVCPEGSEFIKALNACAPPRADKPINLRNARMITAFSDTLRETVDLKDKILYQRGKGWPILRTGSQVEKDWCNANVPYLPCGPKLGTKKWEKNLVRFLEVTARIPNVGVSLIPTFTRKSDNPGEVDPNSPEPDKQQINVVHFCNMFDTVNAVVKAGDYKHIIWEAFNEPVHPLAAHLKDEDVEAVLIHMKANTDLPIGVDYHGGSQLVDLVLRRAMPALNTEEERFWASQAIVHDVLAGEWIWRGRYPYIWRQHVDYIAFHTPRNPEPSYEIMKAAQDKYKYTKPVIINETVAYASDWAVNEYKLKGRGTVAMLGRGTEKQRMDQCVQHLRDIHRLGWRGCFHMMWGFATEGVGDLPDYKKDIAGN
jgi:hypothetical protein